MATISQNLLLLSSVKTGKEARPLMLSILYGMEDTMRSVESIGATLSETFPVAMENYNAAVGVAIDAMDLMGLTSYISSSAYLSNSELTSFEGSNITKIFRSAFAYCPNLSQISFPLCRFIGDGAFGACSMLSSVHAPILASTGQAAFQECTSLSSFDMGSIEIIGSGCFYRCSALESVNAPAATSVGGNAFAGCVSLSLISVPKLQTIDQYAFANCAALPSISLPAASVISYYAFSSCMSLSVVDLTGTSQPPVVNQFTFSGTPITNSSYLGYFGSIWIPEGMMSAFLLTSGWSYYSERLTEVEEIDDPGWEGWG